MSGKWANKNTQRVLVGNRNESDGVEDQGIQRKNYIKIDLKGNKMETVDRLIWLRSDTSGRLY